MAKRPFNKEETFNSLVRNALDFLTQARADMEDHPKYSVIHFHAAVELFLKARLMAEHWTLVVAKRTEPDLDEFLSGDFRSVSLREAATRLSKVVRSGLSKQELQAFEVVVKHRNKMVHFFHEAHTKEENDEVKREIVRQQLNAWYFLNKLLTVQWKEVFKSWATPIGSIDAALRELHVYLKVVFDNLTPEIEKLKGEGIQFGKCPSCGFESQGYEAKTGSIYEAKCLVCKLIKYRLQIVCSECDNEVVIEDEGYSLCNSCGQRLKPEDLVDILKPIDPQAAYIAAKEGCAIEDLGNCSECDRYHTVVYLDELGKYFCAGCFEVFESLELCEWCNEPNTGNMEASFGDGCNVCERKMGELADE